ncbi:MAG: TRAP transporter permease [Burkholderiaceae bacterium]|jgi:TRAP transporter 4TM/12TM fusion protein|nr:TRAP transporter permease [Burkholderiales bacterium]MCZ8100779.1 TRAP transporter permease [Burkholderiales bacterium]MCZ8339947.1 TRAP transporter permease [Burkholderiaceae bacterium]
MANGVGQSARDDGSALTEADLQQLVAEADTGGRKPAGAVAALVLWVAVGWSLFQLWYASPLPFALGVGVLNDTQARSWHLAIGLFLAFLAYPAFRSSSRTRVPALDWALATVAAFCAAYIALFANELAQRPGQPTTTDIVVASIGVLLVLEATRRAVGWPMAALAIVFIGYIFLGPYMPEAIQHKGASLNRMLSHQWLTTEGVFGVALGVSTAYIFIYVLFGALLDRIGAGNYMMQVSFALLGHLRGGPAKVAVVSSALNGLVSGSSVSNVVSGGIFTIPLMKRAGYGGIKAGAIETASSVNGQIMPPVMGAAAFLMVEYVGIPYSEIVKHAFLPAVISYISLFYIVHLEALKLDLRPMASGRTRTLGATMLAWGLGVSGTVIAVALLYWAALGARAVAGDAAPWVLGALLLALYVASVAYAARHDEVDFSRFDFDVLPKTWPTVRAGLDFLIPIGVLVWCLMVEDMSPALAAFWATAVLLAMIVTRPALVAVVRRHGEVGAAWRHGLVDLREGLATGARNMIGIAVATATAGIIVGAITLTGIGLMMTEFVEFVSGGNLVAMLLFTAFVCLVLGMGVPTTANYILVATLMAPVIVELGAQGGLVIPLIAVHLFVFYFGIMGDITPPVGLASFAAAAISGEDAIKTGIQGSVYALRTVILPFIFIFNPAILMIGVESWAEAALVAVAATLASLLFASVTMNWMRVRLRAWEWVALAVAMMLLFRPDMVWDRIYPEFEARPAKEVLRVAGELPDGRLLVLRIAGTNIEGEDVAKTVALSLPDRPKAATDAAAAAAADPVAYGRQRLSGAGLTLTGLGERVQVAAVKFGSRAKRQGLEQGFDVQEVMVHADRPSVHWPYLPACLLAGLVWWAQGRRMRGDPGPATSPGRGIDGGRSAAGR